MKKVIFSLLTISTMLLISCGGSDSPAKDNSLVSGDSANNAAITSTTGDSIKPLVLNAPGGTTPGIITSTTGPNASKEPASSVAKGMNPAHGQPGHRCDIAVGAPLNSPAAAAGASSPAVQTTTTNPVLPSVPAPVIGGSNAKLNPAHGQPGHDCAIAVGAPLKN